MDISIDKIETPEEFFLVFNGLCKLAESAFDSFDEKDFSGLGSKSIAKEMSYLMSITLVIIGMRGGYASFRQGALDAPIFATINGIEYDQKYLYKMNDHFTGRFDDALNKIKNLIPEMYESYKTVWQNY
ncbi:MAG: hypothetical protein Q8Q67_03760 [bacterium]|nr:hypothetical protein [bacterium]